MVTPGSSNITIDALAQHHRCQDVLSSPSIVVQDNSEAVLNVGSEVPITTRSAVSVDDPNAPVVNNIEYRDTGVILEVKPRISSNDVVALEVSQEVSRVAAETTTSDRLTPVISQRKITSRINIQSGQTVVLGGLIQDSETRSKDKIPLLGDVPVLGNLFQSNNNVGQRTELIVFLTPRIIRNAEDARDVSEEFRARMRSVRPITPAHTPAGTGGNAPEIVPMQRPPRPLEVPETTDPTASVQPPPQEASPGTPVAATATFGTITTQPLASPQPAQNGSANALPAPEVLAGTQARVQAKPAQHAAQLQRQLRTERVANIPHHAVVAALHAAPMPKERPWSGNVFIPQRRPTG